MAADSTSTTNLKILISVLQDSNSLKNAIADLQSMVGSLQNVDKSKLQNVVGQLKQLSDATATAASQAEKIAPGGKPSDKPVIPDTTGNERQLQILRDELEELENAKKKAVGGGEFHTMENDVEHAGRAVGRLNEFVKNLGEAIGFLSGGFLGYEAVSFVKDVADVAAKAQVLATTMHIVGENAGISSARLDVLDKQVQKLGITAASSRESLTRMIESGLNPDEAAPLARMAQDAAALSGGVLNSSQSFERLVLAIQIGRPEMLREMGILVNMDLAYQEYARAHGKVAGALTETEKVQARFNATMEYGKRISGSYEAAMGDVGKQLTSLPRLTDQLKEAVGSNLLPAYRAVVTELSIFLENMTTVAEAENSTSSFAQELGRTVGELARDLREVIETVIHYRTVLYDLIAAWVLYKIAAKVSTVIDLVQAFQLLYAQTKNVTAAIEALAAAEEAKNIASIKGLPSKIAGFKKLVDFIGLSRLAMLALIQVWVTLVAHGDSDRMLAFWQSMEQSAKNAADIIGGVVVGAFKGLYNVQESIFDFFEGHYDKLISRWQNLANEAGNWVSHLKEGMTYSKQLLNYTTGEGGQTTRPQAPGDEGKQQTAVALAEKANALHTQHTDAETAYINLVNRQKHGQLEGSDEKTAADLDKKVEAAKQKVEEIGKAYHAAQEELEKAADSSGLNDISRVREHLEEVRKEYIRHTHELKILQEAAAHDAHAVTTSQLTQAQKDVEESKKKVDSANEDWLKVAYSKNVSPQTRQQESDKLTKNLADYEDDQKKIDVLQAQKASFGELGDPFAQFKVDLSNYNTLVKDGVTDTSQLAELIKKMAAEAKQTGDIKDLAGAVKQLREVAKSSGQPLDKGVVGEAVAVAKKAVRDFRLGFGKDVLEESKQLEEAQRDNQIESLKNEEETTKNHNQIQETIDQEQHRTGILGLDQYYANRLARLQENGAKEQAVLEAQAAKAKGLLKYAQTAPEQAAAKNQAEQAQDAVTHQAEQQAVAEQALRSEQAQDLHNAEETLLQIKAVSDEYYGGLPGKLEAIERKYQKLQDRIKGAGGELSAQYIAQAKHVEALKAEIEAMNAAIKAQIDLSESELSLEKTRLDHQSNHFQITADTQHQSEISVLRLQQQNIEEQIREKVKIASKLQSDYETNVNKATLTYEGLGDSEETASAKAKEDFKGQIENIQGVETALNGLKEQYIKVSDQIVTYGDEINRSFRDGLEKTITDLATHAQGALQTVISFGRQVTAALVAPISKELTSHIMIALSRPVKNPDGTPATNPDGTPKRETIFDQFGHLLDRIFGRLDGKGTTKPILGSAPSNPMYVQEVNGGKVAPPGWQPSLESPTGLKPTVEVAPEVPGGANLAGQELSTNKVPEIATDLTGESLAASIPRQYANVEGGKNPQVPTSTVDLSAERIPTLNQDIVPVTSPEAATAKLNTPPPQEGPEASTTDLSNELIPKLAEVPDKVTATMQQAGGQTFDFIKQGFGGVFQGLGGMLNSFTSELSGKGSGMIASFLGFAGGGMISGKGTGTSDDIPIMASHGEYVMTAEKTAKFFPLLEAMRSGALESTHKFAMGGVVLAEGIRKFAKGGMVDLYNGMAFQAPAYAEGGVVDRLQSIATPQLAPRYANLSTASESTVPKVQSSPSLQFALHPDFMHMSLQDWFNNEVARQIANR